MRQELGSSTGENLGLHVSSASPRVPVEGPRVAWEPQRSTDVPRMWGALQHPPGRAQKLPETASSPATHLPSSPALLIPVLPLTQPEASIRLAHPHWSSNSLSSRPALRCSPLNYSTPFLPDPSMLPLPGSLPCLLQPPPPLPPLSSGSTDRQGPPSLPVNSLQASRASKSWQTP